VLDSATILQGINTTASVINALNTLIKGTKGTRRALLLELQSNIRLIMLYADGGAPIDKVIKKLDVSQCKAALESNFNFNSLKRGRVQRAVTQGTPQYKAYAGWTTERLFSNIYLKVRDLQNIVEIDPGNKRFRKNVRLLNVLKLMLLLLRHLRS
jgi:hypothetical protein